MLTQEIKKEVDTQEGQELRKLNIKHKIILCILGIIGSIFLVILLFQIEKIKTSTGGLCIFEGAAGGICMAFGAWGLGVPDRLLAMFASIENFLEKPVYSQEKAKNSKYKLLQWLFIISSLLICGIFTALEAYLSTLTSSIVLLGI